jgi:signal transduction histidine kinase
MYRTISTLGSLVSSERMSSPASPPQVLTSFWTFHLLGWLAIGVSMWLGVISHVDDPFVTGLAKLWFGVSGGLVALLLRPLYRWMYTRNVSIAVLIAVASVVSYVATLLWSGVFQTGARAIRAAVGPSDFLLPSISTVFNGALFYTFIMLAWSVLYFGIKYYRTMEQERARAIRAERDAHRAELQALRYQLHPHFLFNTMNAISTLVAEHRNDDAERMITRLSDFLRLTLEQDAAPEIPLAEELDFTQRYLDIEQIRFGERLQVRVDTPPDTMSAHVPALLLQPLVENAVRHGIAPEVDGGTITLEARRAGDRLLLRVADNGRGIDRAAETADLCTTGVGLSNTRARLKALYDDAFRFDLQRTDGGGCTVILDLPYRTSPVATDAALPAETNGTESYADRDAEGVVG